MVGAAEHAQDSPWILAIVIALSTFMEVLDTTIANVALTHISGSLAIGPDEASWVVTSYLVANAVVLTASSYMAERFGRKLFFIASVGVFTVASFLCGIAWSLESFLCFRVLQGLGGGGMAPLAQSILADSFPQSKRGQAFALYGLAIVFAPVVGPTLGGWISDTYSWHWCFLINVPVGIMAFVLMVYVIPQDNKVKLQGRTLRFDFIGFILVATFLGSLEVILDEGQKCAWFESSFIISFVCVCVLALVLVIPWVKRHPNPIVQLRLLSSKQFSSCVITMLAIGAILNSTTQFLPQIMQTYFGYTAMLAGIALLPGGFVTLVTMLTLGLLGSRIQPKYRIACGSLLVGLSMLYSTNINPESTYWFFANSRILTGIGIPLIFLSITVASYNGLDPKDTDQASALINMARNIGGSIGISFAQNILYYRQQFHTSRLVETLGYSNSLFNSHTAELQRYFMGQGASTSDAHSLTLQWIGTQLIKQAGFLAYIDVFWCLFLLSLVTFFLSFIVKQVKTVSADSMALH